MTAFKGKVSYIAPTLPALSETFVYNEILQLENFGIQVVPISMHAPSPEVLSDPLRQLSNRTHYLYAAGLIRHIASNLRGICRSPARYLKALAMAISDSTSPSMKFRVRLGIIVRFFSSARTAEILIREQCQHIHAHFAHVSTDIAMYASAISGIPFSFTSHATDLYNNSWLIKIKAERSAFMVTISQYNRQFLTALGIPDDKIHIVRCGVDSGSFSARPDRIPSATPKLGSLGRLVEKKGFDVLIKACLVLRDLGEPFTLEIVGDGPLKEYLQEMSQTFGLQDSVRFRGPMQHCLVSSWLKEIDLFVLPCKIDKNGDRDGIPVVLMEAMLSGVPVVSAKTSGIPELVENGATGSLAESGDFNDLAMAIKHLIHDDKLRSFQRENAMVRVAEEFDLSSNAKKMAHLLTGKKI